MTDPRELLDAYAAGEHRDYSGAGQAFRLDRVAPKAFAALRAVLDIHHPVDAMERFGDDRQCCIACHAPGRKPEWPCSTVQAITTALEATDA